MSDQPRSTLVRVAVIADIMDYSAFWYAEATGLFEAHGLDVSVTRTYSVQGGVDRLRSGEFDIALGAPEGVLSQAAPDSELVIIGGSTSTLLLSLMGAPGITSLGQLAGAALGASSATEGTALLMLEMLTSAGVDTAGVRIEPIGVGSVRLEALLEGRIAAGILNVPATYDAAAKGLTILGDVAEVVPRYQFVTVNARRDWLRDPVAARTAGRVMTALSAAVTALYDPSNTGLMVDLVAQKMHVSQDSARRGWADFTRVRPIPPGLRVDPEAMAKTLETMRRAGTLPAQTRVRLEDIYDERFLP